MEIRKSMAVFEESRRYMPGGVNSPVRSFKAVGGHPRVVARGEGAYLYDVDGNVYIDYVGSWGPLILGHAHPEVVSSLAGALSKGTSYGAPTELELELARAVCEAVPSIEMVRMVNSGTEATMSAIRLARGYTGRSKIVKFVGCYHGHPDSLLVKAGSGATALGVPDSAGIPVDIASLTITLPYNDLGAAEEAFRLYGGDIAGVVLEPVAGNMGVVPPRPGYLEGLRRLTREHGALLIFDEVMTGFRVSYGGAQELYGVTPDLTCLGKIIGGGLPVGAYGGKREIMEYVAPLGPVYQAGTLSGNPLAMAAGLATLRILSRPGTYESLESKAARLVEGLSREAFEAGIAARTNRVGSMFTMFFTGEEVYDYDTAKRADAGLYARFFNGMLERGVYLAPSQFEAAFLSTAHTDEDIQRTVAAGRDVFRSLLKGPLKG